MLHRIAAPLSRLISGRASDIARRRAGAPLHAEELSAHMLRDIGLADGHGRLPDDAGATAAGYPPQRELLILSPVAS